MIRMIAFLAGSLAMTAAAMGAATPWQQVTPDVRLRLVSSDALRADGTTMAALEVDMPAATKTYWRVPGESGIPTRIDTSGSNGIGTSRILWPLPQVDASGDVVDFVYYGPTVLPLRLTVDATSATLSAKVAMGICSDICVPVSASFALPLDFARVDHSEGLRISQAVAEVPIAWDGDDEPIGAVDYDPATGLLTVELTDDRVEPGSLIADAGLPDSFFGAPQKRPDGQAVTLPLLGPGAGAAVIGHEVELSFMTDAGPYLVSRTIGRAGSTPPDR
jgi:DsbC/DsbD-like thiol-disulfide interchange protein